MARKRETAQELWGSELCYAMEAAGITGRQLAAELHVVPATVSHWINGKRTPHVKDVERIEERLGTNGYLKRQLLKWVSRETSPEWFEWRGVEEDASELLAYETRVIPGLLQTLTYARTILPSEDLVEQRMDRQRIFDRDCTPLYETLLDESTLYRKVGNAQVMAEQLKHLIELARRDDIAVRIVPLDANINRFTHTFILATVDSGKQVAYLDSALVGRITERPADIMELRRFWVRSGAEALSQPASIDLIKKIIKERWSAG
jgi:transcriptional regulator with XRE-family HTH domain